MTVPPSLDLNGSLNWEPFDIPGGTGPVSLVRVHAEPSRAFTVLVRFPAGWERPAPGGSYEAAEDVVFLEGELEINDRTYRAGEWAYLPAGYLRRTSVARTSVLALARFSGPARWAAGEPSVSVGPALHRSLGGEGTVPSALGAAVRLRSGPADQAWFVPGGLAAGLPSPALTQVLDLRQRRLTIVEAGSPLPVVAGPCFCRTVAAD